MGLAFLRRAQVSVEVSGADIIVRMPRTNFSVVYEKTDDNRLCRQLLLRAQSSS
jgi:hypothetical protein